MRGSTPGLGPMLGALGSGLTAGVIREVILAETGPAGFAEAVAEETGAELVSAEDPDAAAAAAAAVARADWLLLLAPDAVLAAGWAEAVQRHAAARPAVAGWVPAEGGATARLGNLGWALGASVGERCLLAPRPLWASIGRSSGGRPTEGLGRRIGLRRLTRLSTTAG